jgi:hypothetical protein
LKPATCWHLVLRLRMSGGVLPLPAYGMNRTVSPQFSIDIFVLYTYLSLFLRWTVSWTVQTAVRTTALNLKELYFWFRCWLDQTTEVNCSFLVVISAVRCFAGCWR